MIVTVVFLPLQGMELYNCAKKFIFHLRKKSAQCHYFGEKVGKGIEL